MNAARNNMPEEQAVNLVRNALLVAGMEMGREGDHWPVIKSTIYSVVQDWENLKIQRNVDAELKKHYMDMINDLENNLSLCPSNLRADAEKMIRDMRDLYQARFEPIESTLFVRCDAEVPIHIKRMNEVIKTLEEDYV